MDKGLLENERYDIEFDAHGRMKYHPDFHPNHGKPFTEEDLEYLCTFYEVDNKRSLSFAIGKTEHVCRTKYYELKRKGLVDYYKDRYKRKMEA
ncbi:MAG: DNA-entry nuclease [Bacillaceae bacterium]|nr:DNA-entry nuclease [Bacillaceae bacterium]